MFRRLLLFTVVLPTVTTISSNITACNWNLEPQVLLLTSYQDAQYQNSYDQIVYKQLTKLYGKKKVTTIFSSGDDNYYANVLRNFLSSYHINKVFILNPAFQKFLPHSSSDDYNPNSLVRVLQQFKNVSFYFFNNIIADNVEVNNNVYDIRFDSPNASKPEAENYGKELAQHFIANVEAGIANKKYIFDVDKDGLAIVNIGIINNIGIKYQQMILDNFVEQIRGSIQTTIKYNILISKPDSFVTSNIYSSDSVEIVGQISNSLYEKHGINFIVNTNPWYNNIIAYKAGLVANKTTNNKTMLFIGCDMWREEQTSDREINSLAFSFKSGLEIFPETKKPEIDSKFKITPDLALPESKNNTYGVNSIIFSN